MQNKQNKFDDQIQVVVWNSKQADEDKELGRTWTEWRDWRNEVRSWINHYLKRGQKVVVIDIGEDEKIKERFKIDNDYIQRKRGCSGKIADKICGASILPKIHTSFDGIKIKDFKKMKIHALGHGDVGEILGKDSEWWADFIKNNIPMHKGLDVKFHPKSCNSFYCTDNILQKLASKSKLECKSFETKSHNDNLYSIVGYPFLRDCIIPIEAYKPHVIHFIKGAIKYTSRRYDKGLPDQEKPNRGWKYDNLWLQMKRQAVDDLQDELDDLRGELCGLRYELYALQCDENRHSESLKLNIQFVDPNSEIQTRDQEEESFRNNLSRQRMSDANSEQDSEQDSDVTQPLLYVRRKNEKDSEVTQRLL